LPDESRLLAKVAAEDFTPPPRQLELDFGPEFAVGSAVAGAGGNGAIPANVATEIQFPKPQNPDAARALLSNQPHNPALRTLTPARWKPEPKKPEKNPEKTPEKIR
ncbi:MAG: hypothetical protein LBR07_05605, partial [Puniceicoccales bacterium]|nr:hypothetical protein [Puniceicoccales bacterium]